MPVQGTKNQGPGNLPAGLLSLIPFLVVLLSWLIWRQQLPDQLTTQWSGSEPTTEQPTVVVVIVCLGVTLVAGLIALISGFAPVNESDSARPFLIGGMISGIVTGAWFVLASLGLAGESAIGRPVGWGLLALLAAGFGFLPFFVAHKAITDETDDTYEINAASVGATEAIAWSGRTVAPTFIVIAIGAIGGAAALAGISGAGGWDGAALSSVVVLGVLAVFSVIFAAVRVSVDRRGIRVVSLTTGIPLKTITPNRVAQVHVTNVNPLSWGGWGYRLMPGKSAIIIRGGEGISVTLTNDKEFVVTVTDADTGAEVLAGLVGAGRS